MTSLTLAALVAGMRGGRGHGPDPESPLIVRGHALEDDAVDEIQKLRRLGASLSTTTTMSITSTASPRSPTHW